MLPVYVPLLLAAVLLLDRFLSIKAAARYGLAALVLLAALVHIGYSAHRNLAITDQAQVAGFGLYNTTHCTSSEILNYLRDNRIHGTIYSNKCYLAWFWDRTTPSGKHQFLPGRIQNFTSDLMRWADGDTPYILLIRQEKMFPAYDELDIRVLPGVEPVAELADGVLFRVTAAEPFDAERHRARKQRYVQGLLEQAGERVVRADSTWPIRTWGVERADEQKVRAGWDVYRNGRTLTYHKKQCAPADTQTNFLLQIYPADPANLPADRRQYRFENLDFNFHVRGGTRVDDQCLVTAQLPDYPIHRIYIGRWTSSTNRTFWEMQADVSVDALNQLIEQADEQVARAGWNVYRTGRKLIYRKQPCVPADVQAKLVLHVIPADPNDLPANRQQHGYDALGFYFDQRGFRLDDQCIAIAELPAYPIGRIRVGQWFSKEDRTLWEAEFSAGR